MEKNGNTMQKLDLNLESIQITYHQIHKFLISPFFSFKGKQTILLRNHLHDKSPERTGTGFITGSMTELVGLKSQKGPDRT